MNHLTKGTKETFSSPKKKPGELIWDRALDKHCTESVHSRISAALESLKRNVIRHTEYPKQIWEKTGYKDSSLKSFSNSYDDEFKMDLGFTEKSD